MNDIQQVIKLYLGLFDREIIAMLLTLPRIYAFMATSQLIAQTAVPRVARTVVILTLAIIAAPINFAHIDSFDRTIPSYALFFVKEFGIGFVLGYIVGWIFWAVQSAGALIDNQRGAAIAASIDPLQGHETSPLGILFSQAFVTYVFSSGAVLPIIGLLYQSFALWPATHGIPIFTDEFPVLALTIADQAMRIVIIIAGPIVAIMFLAEFALAMVSRFAPQVQVFILAMPIKSALAIFILIFYFSRLLPYATEQLQVFEPYMNRFYDVMRFSSSLEDPTASSRTPGGWPMSGGSSGEKTELPTPKKERDSRQKGQVAKSQEVVTTISLLSVIIYVWVTWDMTNARLTALFDTVAKLATGDFEANVLPGIYSAGWDSMLIMLPILAVVIFAGIAANYIQIGSLFSFETIMPKGEKISPAAGFKRIFSMKQVIELIKSVLKISILSFLLYFIIRDAISPYMSSLDCGVPCILDITVSALGQTLVYSALAFIVVALADFAYQRHAHTKSLMMTKEEVKREYKESEGDPHVKGKRKQIAQEMAMGDGGFAARKGTAVVVNPTHFAVVDRLLAVEGAASHRDRQGPQPACALSAHAGRGGGRAGVPQRHAGAHAVRRRRSLRTDPRRAVRRGGRGPRLGRQEPRHALPGAPEPRRHRHGCARPPAQPVVVTRRAGVRRDWRFQAQVRPETGRRRGGSR